MNRSSVFAVIGMAMSVGTVGCSADMGEMDEVTVVDATGDSEDVASIAEPILGTYEWVQGQLPTAMILPSQGFCLLTRVSGGFRGGGESVKLSIEDGRWRLGGTSQQSGVGAKAICVGWSELGATSGTIWMPPANNWYSYDWAPDDGQTFCYLAGMKGEFNGGAESVDVRSNGANFELITNANSGAGVSGRIACVRPNNVNPKHGPRHDLRVDGCGWGGGGCGNNASISLTSPGVCALTRVAGKFRGGAEYAQLTPTTSSLWNFTVNSHQTTGAVHAAAQCLFY